MKNYIDVKITVWQRYHFKDNTNMNEITATVKEDGVDEAIDDARGFVESEILFDTIEDMTVNENEGCSTIEVYKNNHVIWENGNDPFNNPGDVSGQQVTSMQP